MPHLHIPLRSPARKRRSTARVSRVVAGIVSGLVLAASPAIAASSWSPTLLVNTEAFQVIDDTDSTANVVLQFGQGLQKTLTFDRTADVFRFNDDVYVQGTLSGVILHAAESMTSSGSLTVEGTFSGATIRGFGLATDCDSATSKLLWDATTGRFSCGTDANTDWSNTGSLTTAFDDRYVNVSGDTMTGALTINDTGSASGGVLLNVLGTMSGWSLNVWGSGSTPMLFTDPGNNAVGINTTHPLDPLHIVADSQSDNINLEEFSGGEQWQIGVDSDGDLNFENSTSFAITFADSNFVGIGTPGPQAKLEVTGTMSGASLVVDDLKNCDTIDTNANGVLSCGTDANTDWSNTGSLTTAFDDRYVNVSGDTMTGALTINDTGSASGGVLLNVLGTMSGRSIHISGTGGKLNPLLTTDLDFGSLIVGTGSLRNTGTGTMQPQLYVAGKPTPVRVGSGSGLNAPFAIVTQGRYAYAVNNGNSSMVIYDVSNVDSPTIVGSTTTGLSSPRGIDVQGRYAYVASWGNSSLVIFDISNPASPILVGSSSSGLSGPYSIAIEGKYAYMTDSSNASLIIFDISNPYAPVQTGTISATASPFSLAVQGQYAYVGSYGSNTLIVFDISNAFSPKLAGTLTTGISTPVAVAVQGQYAYVANDGGNLVIVDISDPTAPVQKGTLTLGVSTANTLVAQGRYLYAARLNNSTLNVIDISNPSTPVLLGSVTTGLSNPRSFTVQGRYAYVANQGNKSLQIFDLGGAYVQQLEAGGIEAGTLATRGSVSIGSDLDVVGGVTFGHGFNANGPSAIQNTSTGGYALTVTSNTGGIKIAADGNSNAPHLLFGTGTTFDTNLFRISANTLHTDDAFSVSGALMLESSLSGATINGFGLGTDCDGANQAVQWDATAQRFSCTTITASGGNWSNTGSLTTAFDDRYVNVSGDTMTGALTINPTSGKLALTFSGAVLRSGGSLGTSGGDLRHTQVNLGGSGATNYGYSAVLGGFDNRAGSGYTVVAGGLSNTATGAFAMVGGGQSNMASEYAATVAGGAQNAAVHSYTTIGGGTQNTTSGQYATIGGGNNNTASDVSSTIGGGEGNVASDNYTVVGGGRFNTASAYGSALVGGTSNTVTGLYAGLLGGNSNTAGGDYAAIGGGTSNTASAENATVAGGSSNNASGVSANIAGGSSNAASGAYAVVPGGRSNIAGGNYSFAGGRNARVRGSGTGTFLWSYDTTALETTIADAFIVMSSKIGLGTATPGAQLAVSGSTIIGNNIGSATPDSGIQLEVIGTISGATIYAANSLQSSGSVLLEGTLSGSVLRGFGLATDCDNNTTQKLLWDATTGRFSCGDDQGGSGGITQSDGDARYVNVSGDTMTGALTINDTGSASGGVLLNVLGTMSGRSLWISGTGASVTKGTNTGAGLLPLLSTDVDFGSILIGTGGLRNTGTGVMMPQFAVSGKTSPVHMGSGSGLGIPQDIAVQGRYAYVVGTSSNVLTVVDISNASSPTRVSTVTTGLSSPIAVAVNGHYAYVVNQGNNALVVFDISNPSAPVRVASTTDGISAPFNIAAQGRYVYVTDVHSIITFDVSDPTTPKRVSTKAVAALFVVSIAVQGRYVYVTATAGTEALFIYDYGNPAAPVLLSTTTTNLVNPGVVAVQGRYAYVMSQTGGQSMTIFDVSNPASPVMVGSTTTNISNPYDIVVQDRYAYVISQYNSSLLLFDISNPSSPQLVGSTRTGLSQPSSVVIQGRYAYVVSKGNLSLQVFDLGGAYVQQLEAGGAEVGSLGVRTDATIANNLTVGGMSSFGWGINAMGPSAVSSTSTGAFALSVSSNTGGIKIAADGRSTAPHLLFGTGTTFDTNLYRSAANTLHTDDMLTVSGSLIFGDSINDAITVHAGTWTFVNNTTFTVNGGAGTLEVLGTLSGSSITTNNLESSLTATTGSILISRTNDAPEWKQPTGAMVWYIDGDTAVGVDQGPTVVMPFGMTVTDVDLRAKGAPTGASLIIDINENGTTLFSTRPEIDASATVEDGNHVLSDTDIAEGSEITVDVDQVGSTFSGSGITVMLKGVRKY